MWTTVAFGLLSALALFVPAQSEENIAPLAQKISGFKKDIHRLLEGSRIRRKRQLNGFGEQSDYKLRFESVTPEDLPYLSKYSLTFWISVYHQHRNQALIGTIQGHLLLYELSDLDGRNAKIVASSEVEDIALNAKAFSDSNEQWFCVLHKSGDGYYIRLYHRVGRGLERRQKIVLLGPSDMELVTMKGIHYLVVATYSSSTNQGISYQASVVLYHWTQTQFDAIASRDAHGARSLVCWILGGSLYMAIGQEINNEGNYKVGSPIYFYNSKEEKKLVLWEMLSTFGPTKVRHFYVGGSHYVIFIGRHDAVIYWWSSGQFLEWQTLKGTAFASDLSVLYLSDGEVAIVIALKEIAVFYTLDASGYYITSFEMSFKGSTLASLQFILSSSAYYALALFADSHHQSIWRLTLGWRYLPSVESLDPLQQCLSDTKELLKQRENELVKIGEDSKRVWLRGSNQTVSSKVIVKGKVKSLKQVNVKDIVIIKYTKLPDSSMGLVIAALINSKDSIEDVNKEMESAVYKSTRQEIRGTNYFTESVFVPSLGMESTHGDLSINDVLLSRLDAYALRKVGNQMFPKAVVATDIYTDTANVGALGGIYTNDLLLLHGRQVVTGDLHFSNVKGSSLLTETINSIPVVDLVTTNSHQIIKDLKGFSVLNSDIIEVRGEINGVDLGNIRNKIATVDDYNEFHGRLIFQKPISIQGSLYVTGKVNKVIDLSILESRSVLRDSQQDLTGVYRFREGGTILGDLLVAGSINRMYINNLLTLSSHQIVYADMSFYGPLTIEGNLAVDTVNGVDLSEQVLQKLPLHQFISGRKTFRKNIYADFVDMTDYVTLDNVDPSHLIQDIVQHKQGVVKSNSTLFKEVVVLGNLTAMDGINGYKVFDLPSSVWLKNVGQEIQVPLKASDLHFKNDLDVKSANDLNLDKDFVRSYGDGVITSAKEFHHKINVTSLNLAPGATINGMDLKSFKKELHRYSGDGSIHGTKTINNLDVHGGLNVETLNGDTTSEIMRPHAAQTISGPVEFSSEITSILGNTKSNAISFRAFNGLNIQDYFGQAVMSSNVTRPVKNKDFSHLEASNLSVPRESKINGVSLHDMLHRVVTLNIPQLITSAKSFESTHFSQLISVTTLNMLDLFSYMGEVVMTDEVAQISNKQFASATRSTNAFVRGTVNGIKIEEMSANIFYKSDDNEVTQPFTFKGDIDVGNLFTSSLDGVEWKDLIFLGDDEILGPGWFLSNVHVDKDLFITGRLNGCDLSELASKSLYKNKSSQFITEHIIVEKIEIVGNVIVKNVVNKVSVDQLENFITTSGDQDINSDVIIEARLAANQINFKKLANSVSISEILRDAVKHSVSQEIKGLKTFKESLTATVMSGGDVYAHIVDGIILEELYRTTVWKNGHQEIYGDKILPQLSTHVATVRGYLNGLSLPQDVVLTDVSEHINHPTYFMSYIHVPRDLVIHGLVDGVDINSLVLQRVTRYSDQNITAQLSFFDDIVLYDEMIIDGTINEVVLELVAKVDGNHPINGYKIFIELYVSGPVTASNVNGYNVPSLASSILKYKEDDFLTDVQEFKKPIHAQNSLFVEWVNHAPLRQLTETFEFVMGNLKTALGYLEDFSFSLQQQLSRQLAATPDHVYRFAYFTLFQEIDMGPTHKILNGHKLEHDDKEFSHSMVMWTTEKRCVYMENCCHLDFYYWLRVKKNGIVMTDGAADSGRYYPVNDPTPFSHNRYFFMWTNSTDVQPKWCYGNNEEMLLASYNQGFMEVFVNVDGAPLLSDLKAFRKGKLYVVAPFYYDAKHDEYSSTVVYVYDESKLRWYEHQVLPSFGTLSLDVIAYRHTYQDEILLALGTGMESLLSYSTIYRWNNKDHAFEVLQNIQSHHVTSTLWIQKGRDLLLSLANVDHWPAKHKDCIELVSGGEINIYSYYQEHLKWIQSIPLGGVISLASFSVDGDSFLAAASIQHQTIYIYEWKGYSSFVEIQAMFVGEVRHISTYAIDDDTYMTVALTSGPSKILKMVRKGQHSKPSSLDPTDLEQNISDKAKIISGC